MLCAEGALECGDASPHWRLAPPGKSKRGSAAAPPSKIRRCFAALWPGPCASTQSCAEAPHSKVFGRDGNIRVPSETSSPFNAERRCNNNGIRCGTQASRPIWTALLSFALRGFAARARTAFRDKNDNRLWAAGHAQRGCALRLWRQSPPKRRSYLASLL